MISYDCSVCGTISKISSSILLATLILIIPLSGCLEDSISDDTQLDSESVVLVDPNQFVHAGQSIISIFEEEILWQILDVVIAKKPLRLKV